MSELAAHNASTSARLGWVRQGSYLFSFVAEFLVPVYSFVAVSPVDSPGDRTVHDSIEKQLPVPNVM